MIQTAKVIVTYSCNRYCTKCVNKVHKVHPPEIIKSTDLYRFDEVIVTGGEPTLHLSELYDLLETLKRDNFLRRIILCTTAPNYLDIETFANAGLIDGLTVSIQNDADAVRFNNNAWTNSISLIPMKRARVFYKSIKEHINWKLPFQFKMVTWKEPDQCTLAVNEKLFILDKLFET